jgi:CHAT domain-containing protein
LSREEADRLIKGLPQSERGTVVTIKGGTKLPKDRLYSDPYYWSAFILIGDPN